VAIREERDLELRPDAVGARHEHGLLHAGGQTTEAREPADAAPGSETEHLGDARPRRERLDALHELVARLHVHARLLVGDAAHRGANISRNARPSTGSHSTWPSLASSPWK